MSNEALAQRVSGLEDHFNAAFARLESKIEKIGDGRTTNWGYIFGGLSVFFFAAFAYHNQSIEPLKKDIDRAHAAIATIQQSNIDFLREIYRIKFP